MSDECESQQPDRFPGGPVASSGSERRCVLTINGGSSSLKFAVFAADGSLDRVLTGCVERVGHGESRLVVSDAGGSRREDCAVAAPDQAAAAGLVIEHVARRPGLAAIAAVGHRVVHGGGRFVESTCITAEMIDGLRRIAPLDPEHLPGEIALIEAIGRAIPGVPQVACFDTAFHRALLRPAQIVPIPRRYWGLGVRRYGFHYFLSSHVWRQDHNGFSHQDPGFIDHVVNKKAGVIRVYLPPDANCLLSVTDHCLWSRNYVNVVVAGKQPAPQWLTMDQAAKHCKQGLGIWEWASNDKGGEPDVVMACSGDVPTLETLAAVELIHKHLPELKVRVINVVNLMKLQPASEHPHGLPDAGFDALFTKDKPIIFAFHGYKEEGTTTTLFDMVVLNDLDRFHLVEDVIDRLPQLGSRAAYFKQAIYNKLIEHGQYIAEHGDDMPAISGWKRGLKREVGAGATSTEGDNV
jgi:hypothetical protein